MNVLPDMPAPQYLPDPARAQALSSVLYVDQDPGFRRLHRRVLENDGFSVSTAGDGIEGWNLVHRQNFDPIVANNDMPRMTGSEFARRIRSEGLSLLLVIATRMIGPLLNSDLSAMRFSAILHKPFAPVDLLATAERRNLGVLRMGANPMTALRTGRRPRTS